MDENVAVVGCSGHAFGEHVGAPLAKAGGGGPRDARLDGVDAVILSCGHVEYAAGPGLAHPVLLHCRLVVCFGDLLVPDW